MLENSRYVQVFRDQPVHIDSLDASTQISRRFVQLPCATDGHELMALAGVGEVSMEQKCRQDRSLSCRRAHRREHSTSLEGVRPATAVRHRVLVVVAAEPVIAKTVKEALANPSEDRREKKWRGEEGCLTAPEEGVMRHRVPHSAFKGYEAERWKQGNFQIADTNNKARLVFASRMCIASPRERRKFGGELSSWANKSPFAPFSVPLALGRAPENLRLLPVS